MYCFNKGSFRLHVAKKKNSLHLVCNDGNLIADSEVESIPGVYGGSWELELTQKIPDDNI